LNLDVIEFALRACARACYLPCCPVADLLLIWWCQKIIYRSFNATFW